MNAPKSPIRRVHTQTTSMHAITRSPRLVSAVTVHRCASRKVETPREGLPMKLRKRVRKLERRLDALTGHPPESTVPSEPLDAQRLWRDQVERYEHGTDDTEEWNPRSYL